MIRALPENKNTCAEDAQASEVAPAEMMGASLPGVVAQRLDLPKRLNATIQLHCL